jgi:general stress protein YciG
MASSNPSNFANLPKDKLSEIAAKGGHASHGSGNSDVSCIEHTHAQT